MWLQLVFQEKGGTIDFVDRFCGLGVIEVRVPVKDTVGPLLVDYRCSGHNTKSPSEFKVPNTSSPI